MEVRNLNKTTICRICMRDDIYLFPIFNEVYMDGDAGKVTIADMITECTKYPVAYNDQLPAQICNKCMEAARNAHQFKKQSEDSYCRLKALYDITWDPKHEKDGGSGSVFHRTNYHKHCIVCPFCSRYFDRGHYELHLKMVHKIVNDDLETSVAKEHEEISQEMVSIKTEEYIEETAGKDDLEFNEKPLADLIINTADASNDPLTKDHLIKEEVDNSEKEEDYYCETITQTHIEENHEKKNFVCKQCLLDFSTHLELFKHCQAEGHRMLFVCPQCGKGLTTKKQLAIHMFRHTGEKPFKCKFCSKRFATEAEKKTHEKYHTGEKSFFCETCGKGFTGRFSLKRHIRVHTGEKPYKCTRCSLAFAQANDLKTHLRRHTGERFRCEICGEEFLHAYLKRKHKLQNHDVHEVPPTQRVAKFTSSEEQEQQIIKNFQNEIE